MLWVRIWNMARCTTLCDKVCQTLTTGRRLSPGTPASFTSKTDPHDITEILLKVALNTIVIFDHYDFMICKHKLRCQQNYDYLYSLWSVHVRWRGEMLFIDTLEILLKFYFLLISLLPKITRKTVMRGQAGTSLPNL